MSLKYTRKLELSSTVILIKITGNKAKKDDETYRKIMRKHVEQEYELDPNCILVDKEKVAINAFEDEFLAVLTG